MKRRRLFRNIVVAGVAGAATYAGYKTYSTYRTPRLDELASREELISDLAETIIPRTNTPGAKDAGVGPFVIKMVKECLPKKSQNNFLHGLDRLEQRAGAEYGKSFSACSAEQRSALLSYFEKDGKPYPGLMGKVHRKLLGDSFFTTLKRFTVLGYCTSKAGATQALAYDYVPGKFENTPLGPGQRAWATQ